MEIKFNQKFIYIHPHESNSSKGCPNKHENYVTNSKSSLLRISAALPYFNGHNKDTSARVYFM